MEMFELELDYLAGSELVRDMHIMTNILRVSVCGFNSRLFIPLAEVISV